MDLLYFDSSIWVDLMIGHGRRQEFAKAQVKRANGKEKAVVSSLVLMEVIEVLRKRIIEREPHDSSATSKGTVLKEKAAKKIDLFLQTIATLDAQGKILVSDPPGTLQLHFQRSLSVYKGTDFRVEDTDFCFACRRGKDKTYRTRMMGQFDIQHALLAKHTGCKEIVSADKAFSTLNTLPEFSGITVKIST